MCVRCPGALLFLSHSALSHVQPLMQVFCRGSREPVTAYFITRESRGGCHCLAVPSRAHLSWGRLLRHAGPSLQLLASLACRASHL